MGYNLTTIKSEIDAGNPVIANVNDGTHFVVITGYNGTGNQASDYDVADPLNTYGTSLSNYSVSGLRVFHNVNADDEPLTSCEWEIEQTNGTFDLGNGWKLWRTDYTYIIHLTVSGLPGGAGYWIYYADEYGNAIGGIYTGTPLTGSTYDFSFQVPNNTSNDRYTFIVVPAGDPNSPYCVSPWMYWNDLPSLSVSSSPNPMVSGENGWVSWNVSGGISGLDYGGWGGNICFQWYQNGNPQSSFLQVDIGSSPCEFYVDRTPGNNYQICGFSCNAHIPDGYVSDCTSNFTIESPPFLTIQPTTRNSPYQGDSFNISVTSNISWDVSDNVGWLHYNPSSGSNNGSTNITVDANSLTSSRSGTVTITGGGITRTCSVSQAGATPYLSVSPSNYDVGSEAGNTTFDVSSNISWTVSVIDDVEWLAVNPDTGSNNGSFSATYEENTSIDPRTAAITVTGNGLTETVTVNQEAGTSINDDVVIPNTTKLVGNFPNPFNPTTTIAFDIKGGEIGTLTIFNAKGQVIVSQEFNEGSHKLEWNAGNHSSGVYFYKLQTGSYSEIYKMIMLK
jgi:hypothetical protein